MLLSPAGVPPGGLQMPFFVRAYPNICPCRRYRQRFNPGERPRIADCPPAIMAVRNIWRETDFWGTGHTPTVYRVETEEGGLYDLLQLGREWWLKAVSD